MIHMITYNLKLFLRSIKGILPFVVMLIFIGLTYYPGTNTTIQTAVTTSCFFMFFLMIYIGYILCNNDLDISEQCIYVRCRNKINYYLYKVICVLIFSIVLNLILFTSACLFSIGSKNALTIILWYISAVSVGFCGGAMGQMFHPAIINDRKFSTVFIILISTLCACKTNILNSHPVLHYFFFVFPPIENFTSICQISNWGEFIIIAKETLIFLIYGIIYETLKSFIWEKRKFLM